MREEQNPSIKESCTVHQETIGNTTLKIHHPLDYSLDFLFIPSITADYIII